MTMGNLTHAICLGGRRFNAQKQNKINNLLGRNIAMGWEGCLHVLCIYIAFGSVEHALYHDDPRIRLALHLKLLFLE